MADLNSTLVRGKLRVTQDEYVSGNLDVSGNTKISGTLTAPIVNLINHDNGFRFVPPGYNDDVYINYRANNETACTVKSYRFNNGDAAGGLAPVYASAFYEGSTSLSNKYLKLSGGTMTGVLTVLGSQYTDSLTSGALNMNNSDIYGLNSIKFSDESDNAAEGIHFYRDATHADTLWDKGGVLYYVPNRAFGTSTSAENSNVLLHSGNYTSYALPKTGGTLTGLLTTTSGATHNGVKIGNTYVNAINGELILQNNTSIRFGGDTWDYNVWAGLKYNHSTKTVYLGLADGTQFTANNAQSGGKLRLPGISEVHISGTAGNDMTYSTANPKLVFSENGGQAVGIVYTDYDSYRASKGLKVMDVDNSDGGHVWFEAPYLYGNGAGLTSLNGDNIASGTVPFARLPTGTGASQVAIGNHTHSYLPLSGGTLTGAVTFANGTYNTVGDDSKIGDINVAGTLGLKGANGTTALAFVNKDNSYYTRLLSQVVTANIDVNLPNAAGTLALVGDNNHTHSQYVTSSGVTSVATSGTGLSGGTITSTGTITLDSSAEGNRGANKVVIAKAAGQINSEKFTVTSGTTEKATIQYNSSTGCLEIIC